MIAKHTRFSLIIPHGLVTSFVAFLMLFTIQLDGVNSAAVMSVDLGSEWMKVGVVSPGVPMEIALNKESKRKTPAIIAFRENVRTFGEDAITVGIRDPNSAYGYITDLLGKSVSNPVLKWYRERFPYYDIVGDTERNTVVFRKSEEEQYSVEELVAQILVKAREFAEQSTGQIITECVLIVPGFFGQAEREALLTAADLANLKILQLMNDYTAVALHYGVFHQTEINETAQYYIFYDMGAYKTSAAVVSYQLVKDKQTKEINPTIQVLGVGYDRALGGLEVQLRLRDYLAKEFNAMKKTKSDVTKSSRALAKLFKEAGRVKNVLSANNDHFAQIENLIDDQDFKLQVTREKLEELCADLWPRLVKPLEDSLVLSGLSMEVISQLILFGGGTRMPKVQEILKAFIQRELGKSLNADEAAAMGAVYKAADLATGFRVKKFIIKDAVLFPIHVSFERDHLDSTMSATSTKYLKRQLFALMNPFPQKKVITFNKHERDFDLYVHYNDLQHLDGGEIANIGSMNISTVAIEQIQQILEKTKNELINSKGIKAYFLLDDSGIFKCVGIEFIYEKQNIESSPADDMEGTLSKLSSTITKLFSKKEDNEHDINPNAKVDEQTKPDVENGESSAHTSNEQSTDDKQQTELPTDENSNTNQTEAAATKNDTIKTVIAKEQVPHRITLLMTEPLSGSSLEKSRDKLNAINSLELERKQFESAFNALETHVIDIQEKLQHEEFSSCVAPETKQKILDECSAISEWLYDDIENPTSDLYQKRLDQLKKLTNDLLSRHWEHQERPDAVKALDGMISTAKKFYETGKNFTSINNAEKGVFTPEEITGLEDLIKETEKWKETEIEKQNLLQRHEQVRLTVKQIADKISKLDREVKYLVGKIKKFKPKPSKPETNTEKDPAPGERSEENNQTAEQFDEAGSKVEDDDKKEGSGSSTPRTDL